MYADTSLLQPSGGDQGNGLVSSDYYDLVVMHMLKARPSVLVSYMMYSNQVLQKVMWPFLVYHSLQHCSGQLSRGKFELATSRLCTSTNQCGKNPEHVC